MKKCPSCHYQVDTVDLRCSECGAYYSKIIELIEQEVADEEKYTLRARYRRILAAKTIKQGLLSEFSLLNSELSQQAKWVLLVIFIFIFAMVFAV